MNCEYSNHMHSNANNQALREFQILPGQEFSKKPLIKQVWEMNTLKFMPLVKNKDPR